MTDYATRRTLMVDTQVRPSDVTKFPIIDAMLRVPRENFVPRHKKEAAYVGENIDLGGGRVVLEPRTLAKLLDGLDIAPDELVLDVGAAYGYSSAVVSLMAQAVVALEEDADMLREAQDAWLAADADTVIPHEGTLSDGAPDLGPYDVILIQGGVAHVPDALIDQLKEGGRIGCLFVDGAVGEVRIGYKLDGKITWRRLFNAGAPTLSGFERHAQFAL